MKPLHELTLFDVIPLKRFELEELGADPLALRKAFGLTQKQAADLVNVGVRAWQKWEAPRDSTNHRHMPIQAVKLFLLMAILKGWATGEGYAPRERPENGETLEKP